MNNILNDISGNIPKSKRGRKPKDKTSESAQIIKSTDEIKQNKVISKKQINFSLESDSDLKHMLNDKSNELEELKTKYAELNEKYNKFSYLETIVTDNGAIDKKYYIPNSLLLSENGDIWKETTDLWCSWCVHSFTTVPIGLPEMYCQKTKKYHTRECFCSFNCAHAFNLSLGDYKVWERYALLTRIKNLIYKQNDALINKAIMYAPPRQLLKVFGGDKTIEEFRNNHILVPKEYIHLLPPTVPFFTVIEEIPKYFQKNKLNGSLKIQRSLPLPMKKHNLMNLFDK